MLLSPSSGAQRELVNWCEVHGLVYNSPKNEATVFKAGKIKAYYISPVTLGGVVLKLWTNSNVLVTYSSKVFVMTKILKGSVVWFQGDVTCWYAGSRDAPPKLK